MVALLRVVYIVCPLECPLECRECEPRISQTVSELRKLLDGVSGVVLAGHCTGWRAKTALAEGLTMGRFQPLAVGGQYVFKGM